jgi:acetamidase/formamidase
MRNVLLGYVRKITFVITIAAQGMLKWPILKRKKMQRSAEKSANLRNMKDELFINLAYESHSYNQIMTLWLNKGFKLNEWYYKTMDLNPTGNFKFKKKNTKVC